MTIRRFLGCCLGTAALLLVLASAGVAGWIWWGIYRPFQGYSGAEQVIVVEPGESARQILRQLEQGGVLADARLARVYLSYRMHDPPLLAGEYRFRAPLSAPQVLDRLARGEVVTHSVTLVEGLTLEETAAQLVAAGFGHEEGWRRALRDPTPIRDLDAVAPDLEGYLYPDTYSFARGTPEAEIAGTLARNFRQHFESTVRPLLDHPGAAGVRGLVTLASIVEKEAQRAEERPLIAAVYANRLRLGMGLYADPTVIYGLKRRGRWDGNLRRPDLQIDDPYNTYRHPGLPPGPIGSPGVKSLVASARPADVPYLYFVSRNDGSHVFASTLVEHNQNVARWQKQYWRERWAHAPANGAR